MILGRSPGRRALALGLGLAAGAVLSRPLEAQRPDTVRTRPDTAVIPIPPRPDTLPIDAAERDTTPRVVRDTIQPPLAAAPVPGLAGSLAPYVWDREAIFSSGALTLSDLLELVPGVTDYRAGWLLTPEQVGYLGAFGRVRVFYDGVELDGLDARTAATGDGGPLDLASIELWPLERVVVERGAAELRVHLRSWHVRRTTPDTRTDVATGEPNINQFRGFFGRRFGNGAALQFGFQQTSAGQANVGGDGDQLGLIARGGWASTRFSLDAYAVRTRRVRADLASANEELGFAPLVGVEDARTLAYVRAGYRDPATAGLWAQLIAATDGYRESSDRRTASSLVPADSADTTRSRAQYVATVGWNGGPLRLEGTGRLRVESGVDSWFSPAVRAGFATRLLAADVYAEQRSDDSTRRLDAALRLTPLPFLALSVAAARSTPTGDADERVEFTALRGEAGLRVRRAWLLGGVMTRDGGSVGGPPVVFDRALLTPAEASIATGRLTGAYAGVRGPVYRDVSADVRFTRWNGGDGGLVYQPQNELRGELRLDTQWRSRFPSGEFGLRAAGIVDYRSGVQFLRTGPDGEPTIDPTTTRTLGTAVLSALLEIRIQEATLFFQGRNLFSLEYELVPGLRMPRQFLLYGVRWQFWN